MSQSEPERAGLRAKKYPMTGKLKGSIYGTPKISSILASFESSVLNLHNARSEYKDGSKAYAKRWDEARLEAATRMLEMLEATAKEVVGDIEAKYDGGGYPNEDWKQRNDLRAEQLARLAALIRGEGGES